MQALLSVSLVQGPHERGPVELENGIVGALAKLLWSCPLNFMLFQPDMRKSVRVVSVVLHCQATDDTAFNISVGVGHKA